MSIIKKARWEFTDGPLKNSWGFVGESMGCVIKSIELVRGAGIYETIGRDVEADPEGEDRVVYLMHHVSEPNNFIERCAGFEV